MTNATPPAPEPSSAYDRMVYPGLAFSQSHPGRLATLASLHGMAPQPVERCRVLELGCGDGGNLIPMAYQNPESSFVGIDLSARAIGEAVAAAAELGLRNIRLSHLDIMDVGADFGHFDYIIAHGVYSWVPAPVRDRMMRIFRDHLAPAGVAYVSYNAYPGSYLRDLARNMMLYHVRATTEPDRRVEQARTLLQFVAQFSSGKELYGQLVRAQYERVRNMPDNVLYHDDLDESARAFFFHQVVEDAERQGLQYLSDVDLSALNLQFTCEHLPEDKSEQWQLAFKMIQQIPEEEAVAREQYLDFVLGRAFRETLLCHGEVKLLRRPSRDSIKAYHLCGQISPADGDSDPNQPGVAQFKMGSSGSISTDLGLGKAALLHLGAVWPRSIDFPQLLEEARARLGSATPPIGEDGGAEAENVAGLLFRAYWAKCIELHLYPPRLTVTISERPQASLVARRQAARGPLVTNLRHATVELKDEIVRRFLVLVDGTRTVDEIVRDLNAAVPVDADVSSQTERPEATREAVESNLSHMARVGLLVG